jgi:hypothetical protein
MLLIVSAIVALVVPLRPLKPLRPFGLSRTAAIASTDDLIAAMQKQYATSWYTTATFVQKTTNIAADGTSKVETWYEALKVPGYLRIDFTPVKDGNGILFAAGKIYQFKNGAQTSSRPYIHPLMLLGFDIYRLPAAEVVAELDSLKFDRSVFHDDVWQGRPVYVVGAAKGDVHTAQFWIDQEHLYFVRMIRPAGTDGARTQETQFNKYVRLGGGWMSPEVVFKTDGVVATTEEYSDLRADVTLDARLFDPAFWTTVHWRELPASLVRR